MFEGSLKKSEGKKTKTHLGVSSTRNQIDGLGKSEPALRRRQRLGRSVARGVGACEGRGRGTRLVREGVRLRELLLCRRSCIARGMTWRGEDGDRFVASERGRRVVVSIATLITRISA